MLGIQAQSHCQASVQKEDETSKARAKLIVDPRYAFLVGQGGRRLSFRAFKNSEKSWRVVGFDKATSEMCERRKRYWCRRRGRR